MYVHLLCRAVTLRIAVTIVLHDTVLPKDAWNTVKVIVVCTIDFVKELCICEYLNYGWFVQFIIPVKFP